MLFKSSVCRELIVRNGDHGMRGRLAAKLYAELDERISDRGALAARIAKCADNGQIVVLESGRDCDCVEYSGRQHHIEASAAAFHKLRDEIAEWADGPFRLEIVSLTEAARTQYSSRDLALEAFEDGHPHHIVSSY